MPLSFSGYYQQVVLMLFWFNTFAYIQVKQGHKPNLWWWSITITVWKICRISREHYICFSGPFLVMRGVYGGEKEKGRVCGSWGAFRSSSYWRWQISWQALSCVHTCEGLMLDKPEAADLESQKQFQAVIAWAFGLSPTGDSGVTLTSLMLFFNL